MELTVRRESVARPNVTAIRARALNNLLQRSVAMSRANDDLSTCLRERLPSAARRRRLRAAFAADALMRRATRYEILA